MKIKFSAKYEGKCDVCKKKGTVFTIGDEETMSAVTICQRCVEKGTFTDPSELIKEHGKKNEEHFKSGVRYVKGGMAG